MIPWLRNDIHSSNGVESTFFESMNRKDTNTIPHALGISCISVLYILFILIQLMSIGLAFFEKFSKVSRGFVSD